MHVCMYVCVFIIIIMYGMGEDDHTRTAPSMHPVRKVWGIVHIWCVPAECMMCAGCSQHVVHDSALNVTNIMRM